MFADESDEVCRLCYHLSSTFTEGVGRITASDQTVQAVHSCISWLYYSNLYKGLRSFVLDLWMQRQCPVIDHRIKEAEAISQTAANQINVFSIIFIIISSCCPNF